VRKCQAMQAELSRAGEFVGVVTLTEDGVTVDLESPDQQEYVEKLFRKARPITPLVESSQDHDRRWFEKVLGDLASEGYDFHLTKTDTG
jgi:hypothetical protein